MISKVIQSSWKIQFYIKLINRLLFQNFRQDYCRYDIDILEHLEHIENITFCQGACQNVPHCNFFTFLRNQKVCKLQFANFDTRICDIVHGTASPSFQSCLDYNKIPWVNVSGIMINSLVMIDSDFFYDKFSSVLNV